QSPRNRGVSKEGELLDLGMKVGIVLRSGTWYSMKHPTDGEIRLGQGMERSRQFLIDNPDLAMVIEKEIFYQLSPVDPSDQIEEGDGEGAPDQIPAAATAGKESAPAAKKSKPSAAKAGSK
ncbi:MAG: DNA recombination/repair protein RecA, partial [Planctomycetota bacterium]